MLKENDKDEILVCEKCSKPFLFRWWEQKFYKEKGLNSPKVCQKCRQLRQVLRS